MPQLGETVAEGKITKWFKKSGDSVKPGENLFEIETDKTSMEVPSTVAGTLSTINFGVGEVAKVGAVVAVISGAGETAKAPMKDQGTGNAPPKAPLAPKAVPSAPPPTRLAPMPQAPFVAPLPDARRGHAYPDMELFREVRTPTRNFGPAMVGGKAVTPLARRLAGERGIDLSTVKGSGPHGRVVAADIGGAAAPSAAPQGVGASQVKALYQGVVFEEVPLDGMRATIARRLTEAASTIPHFYLTSDIDVGRLVAMREEANGAAPSDNEGNRAFRLSLNDFIIKAWAAALQRVPQANAVWAGDRILRFKASDIGVAVALDGGLITPVIRSAETKSLTAISAEMRGLAARAKDKKLRPEEYQGGASAISNLGMYGIREFSAIINPPHATILAVGATRRAPVETENGGVKFVSQISVTLSCDHRIVDGALGAQLLEAFKGFVENPVTALV